MSEIHRVYDHTEPPSEQESSLLAAIKKVAEAQGSVILYGQKSGKSTTVDLATLARMARQGKGIEALRQVLGEVESARVSIMEAGDRMLKTLNSLSPEDLPMVDRGVQELLNKQVANLNLPYESPPSGNRAQRRAEIKARKRARK